MILKLIPGASFACAKTIWFSWHGSTVHDEYGSWEQRVHLISWLAGNIFTSSLYKVWSTIKIHRHLSQDHVKTEDFRRKREDESCLRASRSKRESWMMSLVVKIYTSSWPLAFASYNYRKPLQKTKRGLKLVSNSFSA